MIHVRGYAEHKIWDSYNLERPINYTNGTGEKYTDVYDRNLGVNGSQWTFLSATNAATTSIYAPTAAGTSGQVLTSTGGVPTWSNISSVGDSRYVLKSGDTMTGNLTMNGGWLQFSNNNWSDKGGAYKESEGSLKVWRVSTDAENKPSAYGSVLQINSRSGHWNTQLWIDQTNTAGNNGKLRYRSTKNYSSVEWNDWTVLATEDYVNSKAAGYLPLTGGTLTGQLIINATSNSLIINNTSSGGNESFIKVKLNGTDKAAIGFLSGSGSYIHNYESSKYLFVKSDGAYFGTPSSNTRVLTTSDVQILPASYKNDPNSLPINQIFYAETQEVTGTPTANGLILSAQGNDEGMQFWTGSDRTSLYFRTKWTSYGNWIQLADRSYVSGNYLPLTGGTMSGSITIPGNTGQSLIVTANESSNYVNAVVYKKGNTSHAAMMGYHSTGGTIEGTGAIILVPYPTDTNAWAKTVGLYIAKNELLLDGNAVATQSWTTSQGYITSSALSGYATQSWVTSQNYAIRKSDNVLISHSNEFNFTDSSNTSIAINYRGGSGSNTSAAITEYRFYNGQGSYSNVNLVANSFTGSLIGNASSATKLGSSTVGGTAKPIYLSAGTATACSATVGSSTVPVYMNAGTITQCSTTLGVSITGNAATATTSTKWNGYDIWVGTSSQLPSSRSSTTIYIVTDV